MNVHLQARSLDFNFSILFGQAVHTLRIHCSLLEHNSGSKAGQYSRESEHNLGIIRDLFSQQSLIEGQKGGKDLQIYLYAYRHQTEKYI